MCILAHFRPFSELEDLASRMGVHSLESISVNCLDQIAEIATWGARIDCRVSGAVLVRQFRRPHVSNTLFIENATYPMKKSVAQLIIVSTQPINDLKLAEVFL